MNSHAPLQSFDEVSDKVQCAPRLALLRAELHRRGLDGFVVARSDAQQNEYLAPPGLPPSPARPGRRWC